MLCSQRRVRKGSFLQQIKQGGVFYSFPRVFPGAAAAGKGWLRGTELPLNDLGHGGLDTAQSRVVWGHCWAPWLCSGL